MAVTLRRLRWVLEVDKRDFDRQMGGVQRTFRRLGRVAARGLAVFGLANIARGTLKTADAIAKMADAANVGVEALQELRHVAELAGISTAQFDDALLAFNRRLGDLQLRRGPLFSFLKDYNRQLLFTLMRTDDTTTAFTLFAEAVRRAPTRQLQAALVAQGMGRGGLRMVNLLRGGAAGLAAGRQRAREDITILLEEQVRTAERIGDAQARAQEKFNSQVLSILLHISGFIEKTTTRVDQWFEERRGGFLGGILQRGRDFILN